MKILMLIASLEQGGAETHVCSLAAALAKRGNSVCVASSGGQLAHGLVEHGVRHVRLPLHSKSPLSVFLSIKGVRRLIRDESPDIIHIHSRISGLICRIALGRRQQCVVSTVHSHFKSGFWQRRLSFWGNASIAVSEDLRDYLSRSYRICADNIDIIPNGIDTQKFSPATFPKNARPPRIVFVSRMDSDCCLCALLLCRIAPRLAQNFSSLTIELVGGGSAYNKVLRRAEAANSQIGYHCIHLSGHIPDVESALRRADVFLGVSRAALEAMSCAVPTVLAGNEGYIGILDSAVLKRAAATNFCCRGSDMPTAEALLSDLCALLEMSSEQRQVLGEHLRKYVIREHSIDKLASDTENFYRRALLAHDGASDVDTVLCGYYGAKNLGDDALLAEALRRCREEDRVACVICQRRRNTRRDFGVRCISRTNLFGISKLLRRGRRLILGGGSILQNTTSNRSLFYYSHLILSAKRKGARVELWANGLGPLKGQRARAIAARALCACDRVGLRDASSVALAKELGVDEDKLVLEDDLAATIAPSDDGRLRYLKKKLGIGERAYALIAVNHNSKRSRISAIRRVTEKICKDRGTIPVFVAMQRGGDASLSRRLAKRSGGIACEGLTARELRGLLRDAAFAMGDRYHLLYLSMLENIPIFPFGDDPKILSLAQ